MDDVVLVHGEQELFARATHLLLSAQEVACAAADLHTWAVAQQGNEFPEVPGRRIRKLYRPSVLLDPSSAEHLRQVRNYGADIRISQDELNETIIIDRRLVILAGDPVAGTRDYSVITRPEVVQGVSSLFEAAWRAATELDVYDASLAEVRQLAPRILELLADGRKDESAARVLGLGVRTYRRRVAELMTALGADSRFQAGVRARELGLV